MNHEARVARFDIRDRAIAAAKRLGYAINPDFHTDGELNMGSPERQTEVAIADCERGAQRIGEIREAEIEREANTPRIDVFAWMRAEEKEVR